MASTQTWTEYNGATAATATASRTEANWKNIDDSTTAYSASPITAGNNSFDKNQAVVYGGTWNTLSALTYKVSTATPGTGLNIVASVRSAGVTPTATASGDATASTTGTAANFASISTGFAVGAATATGSGVYYGQVYRTQLQTTVAAAPGDLASAVTITATWTES